MANKNKQKREYTPKATMKRIAIWKANHPEITIKALAEKYGVKDYVARYALRVHAELAETMKNTKKGRFIQSRFIADDLDQIEILKQQLNFCLAELENNNQLAVSGRLDLLYKAMRIRVYLQQVEIESHIKRLDANIIAAIVRRYKPDATDTEIIKIYEEEYNKWKASAA